MISQLYRGDIIRIYKHRKFICNLKSFRQMEHAEWVDYPAFVYFSQQPPLCYEYIFYVSYYISCKILNALASIPWIYNYISTIIKRFTFHLIALLLYFSPYFCKLRIQLKY